MEKSKKQEEINAEDFRRDVSYSVYRDLVVRHENTVKRLITAIIIIVVVFLVTFAVREWQWIKFIDGYDFSSESYVIDSNDGGNANYLESGNDGVINNGENRSETEDND